MTPQQQLYYAIGQMAYSIAAADGRVHSSEKEKLHQILSGNGGITFNEDYAEIIFEVLKNDHTPVNYSYDWAIKTFEQCRPWLNEDLRNEFTSLLRKVAEAYPPVTADESKLLKQFLEILDKPGSEVKKHEVKKDSFKKILIPVDYSDLSETTIRYGMAMAKKIDAEIILYHAIRVPIQAAEIPVTYITETDIRKEETEHLEMFQKRLKVQYPEINFRSHTSVDFTADGIIEASKNLKPDLIIMGVNDTNAMQRTIIGSNSERVINEVDVPVIIINNATYYRPVRKVLFACDLRPRDFKTLLSPLKMIAGKFNSLVDIVNVIPHKDYLPDIKKAASALNLEAELPAINHMFHFPVNENFKKGLTEFAEKTRPDLLVMVHHKRGFLERFFSEEHSKEIIFGYVNIPLMIIPDSVN